MILNVEIVVICYMHYYRYRYCYYYILLVPIEQLYCPQALISTPPAEIRPWERGYSSELVNLSAIVYFAWSPHQSHARATPGNSPIHMFSFMNMTCTKLKTKNFKRISIWSQVRKIYAFWYWWKRSIAIVTFCYAITIFNSNDTQVHLLDKLIGENL